MPSEYRRQIFACSLANVARNLLLSPTSQSYREVQKTLSQLHGEQIALLSLFHGWNFCDSQQLVYKCF